MTGPEDAPRVLHEGEAVRISELVDGKGWLDNHDFLRCTIQGPALLVIHGCIVHENQIDGFPDECFYYVEDERERYVGAIIAFGCGFESCTFANVGFAGPSDNLDAFRASIVSP